MSYKESKTTLRHSFIKKSTREHQRYPSRRKFRDTTVSAGEVGEGNMSVDDINGLKKIVKQKESIYGALK